MDLPAGQTSIPAGTKLDLGGGSSKVTAIGSYFIAATDDLGKTFTSPVSVKATEQSINLDLNPNQATFPGTGIKLSGGGYAAGASVEIWRGAPASPPGTLLTTLVAGSDGSLSGQFALPALAGATYKIYAKDTSTGLTNGVGKPLTIVPGIRVAPRIIDAAKGQVVTVSGFGYPAAATIKANSITVAGTATTHPAVTADSTGEWVVSVTTTTNLGTGFNDVVEPSQQVTARNVVLVSLPGFSSSTVALVPTPAQLSQVTVGASRDIAVFNYPANTALALLMGGRLVKAVTTDSHGADIETVTIPDAPGSAAGNGYLLDAVNGAQGFSALNKLPLSVQSSLAVTDLAGAAAPLVRPNGRILVSGSAFAARESLTIMAGGTQIGTASSDGLGRFSAALAVRQPSFVTGTPVQVSASGAATGLVSLSGAFVQWATPTSIDLAALNGGVGAVGDIVMFNGHNFAPGRTYQVRFNNQPLSPDLVFTAQQNGDLQAALNLTVPSLAQGVYTVTAVPLGLTAADATELFVVSTANSVPTVLARTGSDLPSGALSGVAGDSMDFFLFGWKSAEAISIFQVGQSAPIRTGTVAASGGLQLRGVLVQHLPGGSYLQYAQGTLSGVTRTANSKVLLTIGVDFQLSGDSGQANAGVGFSASGLAANAAYDVLFGGTALFTGTASGSGDLSGSFAVPVMLARADAYDVKLASAADGTVAASAAFRIAQAFTLDPSPEAIFGQSVHFSWDTQLSPVVVSKLVSPIALEVLINGAPYLTIPVAKADFPVLTGAFSMANAPGDLQAVTLRVLNSSAIQTTSGTSTLMTESGAGAIFSGIDLANEFAIVKGMLGNINVSLAELNPRLDAINGTVAHIQTNLGLMNANVSAINAKVTSISNGVATIQSEVGTIQTSVSAIDAKVTSIQGTVATISTAVGSLQTDVSTIHAQITSIQGDLVKLDTDVGTATTTIANLQPVVTSIQGNVATIKTSVGSDLTGQVTNVQNGVATITTSVGDIKVSIQSLPGTSAVNNILYVAIAAAVLALIGAVGAIAAAAMIMRRLAK